MLKIYLARHGQNADNIAGILNGHRDMPLTERGIEQAHETGDMTKAAGIKFDAVYTSPLIRAHETAKIISEVTGSPVPVVEPLLIERNFGIMTGKPVADIEKLCAPDIIKAEVITYFLSPQGAETFPDLMNRGHVVLDKIRAQHAGGNVLLVTHGDIGKMVYAAYYDLDWEQVLMQFNFGNCDLLLMAEDSKAGDAHVFRVGKGKH